MELAPFFIFFLRQTINTSAENTEKNLVGQPILKQILNFIPRNKFDLLVSKHNSDRYYKTFNSWSHRRTMLFGIFSRCDSMDKICDSAQNFNIISKIALVMIDAEKTTKDSKPNKRIRAACSDKFRELVLKV